MRPAIFVVGAVATWLAVIHVAAVVGPSAALLVALLLVTLASSKEG